MGRRKNKRSWEERARKHIKVMRHPAIAWDSGWACLEIGCNAPSYGHGSKPDDDCSFTYEEFWNLW